MEILLEKFIDPGNLFSFQEGMRGTSVIQGTMVSARFIWRDDRWWHVLIDPPKFQPVWIRVKKGSLSNWSPDLLDPATAGIILHRVSILSGSNARFFENLLLLEDGRRWSGESRRMSLDSYLGDLSL